MKKRDVFSICVSERPTKIVRRGMMLGRQIRQGLIDGVSDDCSQLLRNCFDKEHGVQDPYFSFGNDTIGVDKFQRAVNSARQKESLKNETKIPTDTPSPTPTDTPSPTPTDTPSPTPTDTPSPTPTE